MTNPSAPAPTAYLTSISMLDPWESLKVNTPRQLLGADNAHNGGGGQGGPEVDFYDISVDCRYPQLLASVAVGTGTDGGVPSPIHSRMATKARGRRMASRTTEATSQTPCIMRSTRPIRRGRRRSHLSTLRQRFRHWRASKAMGFRSATTAIERTLLC